MSRIALVAISRRGAALARRLAVALEGEVTLHLERRLLQPGDQATAFDLPLRPVIRPLFQQHQALVLFMPVGAVVRLLAPSLGDKHRDPAVVCVDDAGRFAVSLLSGHVGGADQLAEEVARILGAAPVITSASHVTGTLAVDLLGRKLGWTLEAESPAVTRASAAVVNGERVGVFQEAGEPNWWPPDRRLPDNIILYSSLEDLARGGCAAALLITDREVPRAGGSYQQALGDIPLVLYRPRSLAVGMGCRRGVPRAELEELLVDTFSGCNLSRRSLSCIATADLKQDEVGILELAEQYDVPVVCYSAEDLNAVFERSPAGVAEIASRPTPSDRAHSLLGIWGVSEPAALLAAGSRELLVPRRKTTRATIAVARLVF
jgi:cobalt-precorrin 5A hydrolase